MLIFPAIDVKDGACVRLLRGDYATAHKVAENILDTARAFEAAGAKWVHMVDLDGAKDSHPVNQESILSVARETGLSVEVGGGIRDLTTVEAYLQNGVRRVILGSAALKDPAFTKEALQRYGEKIAIGIDARGGKVATEGWLETSEVDFLTFAKQMEALGAKTLIFTDISRDGTLSGPNLSQLDALNRAVSCRVVASGGVSSLADLAALKALGLYGAICGKALYTGAVPLKEAIESIEEASDDAT